LIGFWTRGGMDAVKRTTRSRVVQSVAAGALTHAQIHVNGGELVG
jgi:hypothetical protein